MNKTGYKNVFKQVDGRRVYYQARMRINGLSWSKCCNDARAAAICVDKKLIEIGREPVNILKRK